MESILAKVNFSILNKKVIQIIMTEMKVLAIIIFIKILSTRVEKLVS